MWRVLIEFVVVVVLMCGLSVESGLKEKECPFFSLQEHEFSVYSQNGEDGVILALLAIVGTTNR